MSDQASATAPFDSAGARRLLDQFAVSQAADLALSGKSSAAESLLKELVQRSDAPGEALDLMAKICVQQGRVIEAEEFWRRATKQDPGNSTLQAALVRLNRIQRRPVWLTFVWPAFLALAVTLVCLVALQIQSARRRNEFARLESRIDSASKTTAQASDMTRLSESVNDLKNQQRDLQGRIERAQHDLRGLAATSARIAKTSQELLNAWSRQNSLFVDPNAHDVRQRAETVASSLFPPGLQMPGVVADNEGDHWEIRFTESLFDHDDRLTPASAALLALVAKREVRSQEKIIIEITAGIAGEEQTVHSSESADPDARGTARAVRVEQFLSGLGLFPDGALRTSKQERRDFDLSGDHVVLKIFRQIRQP